MPSFSAHLGYLFTEFPLLDRFAAARRSGFAAIEHPSPYGIPAPHMREMLAAHELLLVQMALPAGDASKGEKGLAALPGRESDFRDALQVGLDYAVTAGARFIQVQSGLTPPGVEPERLWSTYIENLTEAVLQASKAGLEVLIEPIGPATIADYFMDRPDLALRALGEIRRPGLRMLFDVFHAACAHIDLHGFISQNIGAIGHFQIADYPGRHEPGTGTLDFDAIFVLIDRLGYEGHVGCEYKPKNNTVDSLHWLAPA